MSTVDIKLVDLAAKRAAALLEAKNRVREWQDNTGLVIEPSPTRADAYRQVLGVMQSRLDAVIEHNSKRKPAVGITLKLDDGALGASFKAKLVWSEEATRWAVGGVTMLLKGRHGGGISYRVSADGELRPFRYSRRNASVMRDIAIALLDALAAGLAKLAVFLGGTHCCICGRGLSHDQSLMRGIGPECFRHLHYGHDDHDTQAEVNLADQVRDIRKQMQMAHPDRGGDGDGALFARLTRELDRLRDLQRKAAA